MSDKGFTTKGSEQYFAEREARITAHISDAKTKIDEIEDRVRGEIVEIGVRRELLHRHLKGFISARNELFAHREKTMRLVDELKAVVGVCDEQLPAFDSSTCADERDGWRGGSVARSWCLSRGPLCEAQRADVRVHPRTRGAGRRARRAGLEVATHREAARRVPASPRGEEVSSEEAALDHSHGTLTRTEWVAWARNRAPTDGSHRGGPSCCASCARATTRRLKLSPLRVREVAPGVVQGGVRP